MQCLGPSTIQRPAAIGLKGQYNDRCGMCSAYMDHSAVSMAGNEPNQDQEQLPDRRLDKSQQDSGCQVYHMVDRRQSLIES